MAIRSTLGAFRPTLAITATVCALCGGCEATVRQTVSQPSTVIQLSVPIDGTIPQIPGSAVRRAGRVRILRENVRLLRQGATVRLNLFRAQDRFEAVDLLVVLSHSHNGLLGNTVLASEEREPSVYVSLAFSDAGTLTGEVMRGDLAYDIQRIEADTYSVREIDVSKVGGCALTETCDKTGKYKRHLMTRLVPSGDDGSRIDVLLLYTPNVAGQLSAPHQFAGTLECLTNAIFRNSQIDTKIRIVDVQQYQVKETGSLQGDLDSLQLSDDVRLRRNKARADLVSLLVEDGGNDGLAFEMDDLTWNFNFFAYSVVRREAAYAHASFAHEIGHNFGAGHNWDDKCAPGLYFPFSTGHEFIVSGQLRRTVMAVGSEGRTRHFSNANVMFPQTGVPTGTGLANNAATIEESKFVVATFR